MTTWTSSIQSSNVGSFILRNWIRSSHASLVKQNQPTERCQSVQEAFERGLFPLCLDVVPPIWNVNQISCSLAHHLIGEVAALCGLRIPRLRDARHPVQSGRSSPIPPLRVGQGTSVCASEVKPRA